MKAIYRGAMLAPILSLASFAACAADVVSLVELPAPDFAGTAGVSNIAADGTVVGTGWPDGVVVRWKPGQAAENLGGDTFTLENIMPLISADGSTIVAGSYFPPADPNDPDALPVSQPGIWRGGTTWEAIGGTVLEQATPFAISDNGQFLGGSGVTTANPPPGTKVYSQAWTWSAAGGQHVLGAVAGYSGTHAWAISDDGRLAAGYGDNVPDDFTRRGVLWDDGVPVVLTDGEGRPVGQAISCNSDCSIVVGAGFTAEGGSNQAWRWTAKTGVQYLGEVPGAPEGVTYYAFDTTEDGSKIVGSYPVFDPAQGPMNHGFVWTADGGMVDLVAYLAEHGIDYGANFNELVIAAMTRDGRRLLINGGDENYQRQRAIVRIDPDAIFANGFEQ